jgi:uncharacterized delta-60 repeat protein
MNIRSFVALAACAFATSPAFAVDGELDPTFGTNAGYTYLGLTALNFQLPMRSAVLADGRIVTCGGFATSSSQTDFVVAMMTPDGHLDTSFNFNGQVDVDFNGGDDICNAVLIQPNGKILLIGSSAAPTGTAAADFAVARLNTDGTLDTTFGGGSGRVTIGFDLGDSNTDVAAMGVMQSDNKIILGGIVETVGGFDFGAVRLLQDGSRDTSFGSAGRATVDFNGDASSLDQADSVLLDSQGRIILTGIASVSGGSDFALARLLPNGTLDVNFNGDGKATIPFNLGNTNSDISYRAILTHDQKIVMVGAADTGISPTANNDVAIARVLPNGSLDTSFGDAGKLVVSFDLVPNANDVATAVVETANGSLIVGGIAGIDNASNSAGFTLRLKPDGTLDDSYGVFGKETYTFGSPTFIVGDTVLQGTQLIVTGFSGVGGDIAVARISIDSIFANGFE